MSAPSNEILLTAIAVLSVMLRAYFLIHRMKKRAGAGRQIREARAPQNIQEGASELSAIMWNRLGVDAMTIPLDSDWRRDLRIPEGELYEFFLDIAQAFLLERTDQLEKKKTYRELLEFLNIPVGATRRSPAVIH